MTNELFASIFSVQLVFGILQSITLIIATRCNRRANLTMAAFVIVCVILSFDCYLHYTDRLVYVPYLIRVFTPFYTLLGILSFLYMKCLTEKEFKYDIKSLAYFAPLILAVLAYSPIYFYSVEDKIAYLTEVQDMKYRTIVFILINTSNIALTFFSYFKIRLYRIAVQNYYSNLSALQFKWLEHLFLIISILVTSSFIFALVTLGAGSFKPAYFVFMIGFFTLSVFMSFSAMAQVDPLFNLINDSKTEINEDRKKKTIPDQIYSKLKDSINSLLDDQIYIDPDLKLSTLAEKTGHPSYLVSLFINKHYDMTFFELINLHRVEEAKKRLLDPQYQHLTILAISQDVGFSSKSAFNSTFKKVTKMTPSKFKSANS